LLIIAKFFDTKHLVSDPNFQTNSQPFFPKDEANKENMFQDPIAFSNMYTYQISRMKAQHQYITNLQRANMALKNKIKQLEDIVSKETEEERITSAGTKTYEDLEPEEGPI